MKKFISGLIVGLMLSATIAFATEYTVAQNSFPIFVNGIKQNIEALNINGTTWIRLGSISGVLGANAVFDEVTKQIQITTGGDKVSDTSVDAPINDETSQPTTRSGDSGSKPSYYTKDGLNMMSYDGKEYIKIGSCFKVLEETYSAYCSYENKTISIYRSKESYDNKEPLLASVPYISISGLAWIEYTYYTDAILPLVKD